MLYKIKNLFFKLFRYLWTLFLNGLLMILPITITIALLNVSFKLIKSWLEPIREIQPTFLKAIPQAEIIVVIVSIFLMGTILKIFILRKIIHSLEELITRLPLIRHVYSGIKQLVKAFSLQDKITFKEVVMIEFPRKEAYCIGFLTSKLPLDMAPNKNERFFNIFVPTTPNPTSGYFVILPEKDITAIDLTRQEAMAMIISGGIIQPERFVKNK